MVGGVPENRIRRKAIRYAAVLSWDLEHLLCAGLFQANRSVCGANICPPPLPRAQAPGDIIGTPTQRDRIIDASIHCGVACSEQGEYHTYIYEALDHHVGARRFQIPNRLVMPPIQIHLTTASRTTGPPWSLTAGTHS